MASEIVISDPNAHARLFHAVFVKRYAAQNTFLPKRPIMVVHEEQTGSGIAGDKNIRPAVFVEVGADRSHAIVSARLGYPGRLADVGECAVSIVAVQILPCERQSSRAALHRNASPIAVDVLSGLGHAGEVEVQVIRDEKIQMPVTIVIDEGATRSPTRPAVIP